jgi:hypothetical protein
MDINPISWGEDVVNTIFGTPSNPVTPEPTVADASPTKSTSGGIVSKVFGNVGEAGGSLLSGLVKPLVLPLILLIVLVIALNMFVSKASTFGSA